MAFSARRSHKHSLFPKADCWLCFSCLTTNATWSYKTTRERNEATSLVHIPPPRQEMSKHRFTGGAKGLCCCTVYWGTWDTCHSCTPVLVQPPRWHCALQRQSRTRTREAISSDGLWVTDTEEEPSWQSRPVVFPQKSIAEPESRSQGQLEKRLGFLPQWEIIQVYFNP